MKFHLCTLLVCLVAVAPKIHGVEWAHGGASVDVGNWEFPEHIQLEDARLEMLGNGVMRYLGFRLYSAALYREAGQGGDGLIVDRRTMLILKYDRRIRADQITEAATKNLEQNPTLDLPVLRGRLNQIFRAFRDVNKGDEYALLYIPEQGTRLYFNGREDALIEGFDFASAFFGIWLSDYSLNAGVARKLWGD
jgi:hypothetical protein